MYVPQATLIHLGHVVLFCLFAWKILSVSAEIILQYVIVITPGLS